MPKTSTNFNIDDAGMFISLSTLPFGQEKDFIEHLKKMIGSYKQRVETANERFGFKKKDSVFENYLYNPLLYCLWGSFDLALISLVDDFSLSTRDFHPYSNLFEAQPSTPEISTLHNFNYQVMTATHSYPSKKSNKDSGFKSLFENWNRITTQLNNPKNKFDFIGISSFKINNGLLLGTGINVIDAIKILMTSFILKKFKNKGEFIILDSFSSYDLTVLFFSDDIDIIAEVLAGCREMTIDQLFIFADNNISKINNTKWSDIKKQIEKESLLSKKSYNGNVKEIKNSHIFVDTYSNFGFRAELLVDDDLVKKDFKAKALGLIPKYTIKPGHYEKACNILTNSPKKLPSKVNFLLGESDAFLSKTISATSNRGLNFKEYLFHLKTALKENNPEFTLHFRRVKTMPYFKGLSIRSPKFDSRKHTKPFLYQFTYCHECINDIRALLCRLRVAKVVRERILRMYINYNEGVQDPIMFIYFLDLKQLLDITAYRLAEEANKEQSDSGNLHDLLLNIAQVFEQAHQNRFHQSYKMNELPNFNLDFNGGIQQIVSGMDTVYKFVHSAVNSFQSPMYNTPAKDVRFSSFSTFPSVYVAAHPGVESNAYGLRLNYFHVFEPAIFLAEVVKEATNHIQPDRNSSHEEDTLDAIEEQIKIRAFDNLRFDASSVYLPYLLNSEEKIFNYWMVDSITFYVGYFGNIELFSFWFWHISLQTPSIYLSNGAVNEKIFIALLIRYITLVKASGISTGGMYKKAPSILLQNLWNRHFEAVDRFTGQLFEFEEMKSFFKANRELRINRILNCITYDMKDHVSEFSIYTPSTQCDVTINSLTNNPHLGTIERKTLGGLNKYAFFIKETALAKPEYNPRLYLSTNDEKFFNERLFSVLTLFNAHLLRIKDILGDTTYSASLVKRKYTLESREFTLMDQTTNTVAKSTEEELQGSLKFDSFGGFFAAGYKTKRTLLRYRIGVIKSMIDFSLLNKPMLLTQSDSKKCIEKVMQTF